MKIKNEDFFPRYLTKNHNFLPQIPFLKTSVFADKNSVLSRSDFPRVKIYIEKLEKTLRNRLPTIENGFDVKFDLWEVETFQFIFLHLGKTGFLQRIFWREKRFSTIFGSGKNRVFISEKKSFPLIHRNCASLQVTTRRGSLQAAHPGARHRI